jgi:hypothetical protein
MFCLSSYFNSCLLPLTNVTAYSNNSGRRLLLIWRTRLLHLASSQSRREARRGHLLRLYYAAFLLTEGPHSRSREVETQPDKGHALLEVTKATTMHRDKSR